MKLQTRLNERYSSLTQQIASREAERIHQTLDLEVVREICDRLSLDAAISGESLSINGLLSRWRKIASATSTALIIAGFGSLLLSANTKDVWQKFCLVHASVGCWYLSRNQKKILQQSTPVIQLLSYLQVARSTQELSQLWESKGQAIATKAAVLDQPLLTESIQLFDWEKLRDCDQYPHFLICGGTGSGKTYSTERIIKFLGGDATVITTKAKSDQWIGLPVIGKGRDFAAIERALHGALEEMQRRMQNLDNNWEPKIYVLDEFPSITANIESATDIITTLIREAREAKIRLFILSQGRQVKTLKLEGQSDLRENLSDILLGQFATDRAKEMIGRKQAKPALLDWCQSQTRPILVVDNPAILPN